MFSRRVGKQILRAAINEKAIAIVLTLDEKVETRLAITAPPAHIALLIVLLPWYWIPESYCRKHWSVTRGELSEVISTAYSTTNSLYLSFLRIQQKMPSLRHFLKQKLLTRYFSRLTRRHYEIESEIYRLFLDDEIVYTCAFFDGDDNLEQAQRQKFEKVLSRLGLDIGANSILNIGAGWASLERYAVRARDDILVTGLSIAKGQIDWAKEYNERNLERHQNRRITLLHEDYLNHQPPNLYDGITVIGMIEHVGLSGYPEFFRKCSSLLKPGAKLVIHTIVDAVDGRKTASWLDAKIFPGGYIPSVSELTRGSQGQPLVLRNIFFHDSSNYFRTLEHWQSRLMKNKDNILKIYTIKQEYSAKYAEYLFRQWEVYLAASKKAFHGGPGTSQVAHFIFEKQ